MTRHCKLQVYIGYKSFAPPPHNQPYVNVRTFLTLAVAFAGIFISMATAAGCSASGAEPEVLNLAFSYLVNSMDAATLLPSALSRQLITQPQRSDCASEPDPYRKAEKFLGHLHRAVNSDNTKFHTFVQVLRETGQVSIASRLHGKLITVLYFIV